MNKLLSLICLVLSVGTIAFAVDYYASNSGAGVADGTSYANRWALGSVNWTTVDTGDGKLFLCGTIQSNRVTIGASGEEGAPVWVISCLIANGASNDDAAILDGEGVEIGGFDWVRIDGLEITGVQVDARIVEGNGAANLVINNLNMHDINANVVGSAKTIFLVNSIDATVSSNTLADLVNDGSGGLDGIDGITVDGTGTIIEYNTIARITEDLIECCGEVSGGDGIIRYNDLSDSDDVGTTHPDICQCGGDSQWYGNYIHDHNSQGLFYERMDVGRTILIYNNVFANNLKDIIIKESPSPQIFNNLFYETQDYSIRLLNDTLGTGIGDIRNNIFWGVVNGYRILIDSGGNAAASIGTMNYNWHNNTDTNIVSWEGSIWTLADLQANTTFGDNSVEYSSDPFTSKATADFTWVNGAADGIDEGVSISGTFTIDKAGNTRPKGLAWDIGPYEFGTWPDLPDVPPNRIWIGVP